RVFHVTGVQTCALPILGHGGVVAEDACVVVGQAVLLDEAPLAGVGQFRQGLPKPFDGGVVDHHRQQVGAGEVAVVVGLFLAAHEIGRASRRVGGPVWVV